MTVFMHEMSQKRKSLVIWTASLAFLLAICVFMFPEMKNEMSEVNDIFSSMGSFTAAFGMDRINFGTLIGFYAVECGNILGLGGAMFASLIAADALAGEEKEGTAEFLFSHPVSRVRVVTEKLLSVLALILLMNTVVWAVSVGSVAAIGEKIPIKEITLIHISYLILQTELACICFAFSSFMKRGFSGVGIGVSILLYFLNLLSNISDKAKFLRYITPFAYTEGADIVSSLGLDGRLILIGTAYAAASVLASYLIFMKKDIQ